MHEKHKLDSHKFSTDLFEQTRDQLKQFLLDSLNSEFKSSQSKQSRCQSLKKYSRLSSVSRLKTIENDLDYKSSSRYHHKCGDDHGNSVLKQEIQTLKTNYKKMSADRELLQKKVIELNLKLTKIQNKSSYNHNLEMIKMNESADIVNTAQKLEQAKQTVGWLEDDRDRMLSKN